MQGAAAKMPTDKITHREIIQVQELKDMLREGEIIMEGNIRNDLIKKTEELVNNDMGELELSVEFNRSSLSILRDDLEPEPEQDFH